MGASMKVRAWKAGDSGQPSFPSDFKVTKRWEGNCTEVAKNSNKFYHAEIQVASSGSARIFTMYGRVGANNPTKEYRYYPSESSCLSDYESLIRKKRDRKDNPYREVDLAITSIGSEGAKEIKKPMTGVKVDKKGVSASVLHSEVQRLVAGWFGSTGHFVEMNLKCPLGQLTTEQLDKGRQVLDECKNHISKKTVSNAAFDVLTSQFYSLIPHVLPHRINPDSLRLNTIDRIMEKHDTLDTFLDAKNVASVLGKGAAVDEQYKKLRAELEWIDPSDPVHKWIEKLVHETRANNHGFLGRVKVFNIFKFARYGESDHFMATAENIASQINKTALEKPKYTRLDRPDLEREERILFTKANVWPLWHGTRPQNMVGIITRGLLIRPSGAVYTGSMFGDALYHAENSSKSMNYTGCRGAYWSGGSKDDRAFLFLEDVIVGKPHVVTSSQFFRDPPRGCHSVYAVPGAGLYNSENMTYRSSGPNQQHRLRYIVEFQSNQ